MNESTRMPLKEIIHECEERWFEEYQEEFENGTSSDSQIIYAQLLLQGSSKRPADVKQAIQIYKKLSRYSAEAAYRLGQIYLKGKYVPVDLENAYFYIKIATYFRCKCGLSAELIHSGKVSHVHVCFQNEAKKKYATFVIDEEMKNKVNNRIFSWKNNNYI